VLFFCFFPLSFLSFPFGSTCVSATRGGIVRVDTYGMLVLSRLARGTRRILISSDFGE